MALSKVPEKLLNLRIPNNFCLPNKWFLKLCHSIEGTHFLNWLHWTVWMVLKLRHSIVWMVIKMYRVILRHSIVWMVLRNAPLNRLIELRIVALNRWMVFQIQLFKCRNVSRPVASRNASRLRRTHERPFRNGVTQQTLRKQDGFHDITQSGRLNRTLSAFLTTKC